MKVLFLGGTKDGERIEVGDPIGPRVDIAIMPPGDPSRFIYEGPIEASMVSFKTESYHVEVINTRKFGAPDTRFYMYVLDGLDLNDAIEMLMGGYLVTKSAALVAKQAKATTWSPRGESDTDRVP